MIYAIIPFVGKAGLGEARAVVADLAAQSRPPEKVLLIDQGRGAFDGTEDVKRLHPGFVTAWYPMPPLVSLAATWNRALRWAWAEGASMAWVLNNDLRLRSDTLDFLLKAMELDPKAGFVSAYGVGSVEEMEAAEPTHTAKGGPDFSCFLIREELHERHHFDEHFVPAYCEDLDYHRELLLSGYGDAIYSTGICYFHRGSGTLKAMDEEKRARFLAAVAKGARAHYQKKWGGPVNEERFLKPFGPAPQGPDVGPITTPQLFEAVRATWN